MYHFDLSKDVALLTAFKGDDVFFILFSFREAVTCPQTVLRLVFSFRGARPQDRVGSENGLLGLVFGILHGENL
jgi:hypothetical protein